LHRSYRPCQLVGCSLHTSYGLDTNSNQ
jgi:hypothetical protein